MKIRSNRQNLILIFITTTGADVCLNMNGGCSQICENKLGLVHCSCLPSNTLAVDGKSCLTDSEGTKSTQLTSLQNQLGDETTPQTTPGFSTHKTEANVDINNEKSSFTDKMVAGKVFFAELYVILTQRCDFMLLIFIPDQHDCDSLRCDVNAQCLLNGGAPGCACLEGFTGDGLMCVGEYS